MSYDVAASLIIGAVFALIFALLIWRDPKHLREQLRSGRKPQL